RPAAQKELNLLAAPLSPHFNVDYRAWNSLARIDVGGEGLVPPTLGGEISRPFVATQRFVTQDGAAPPALYRVNQTPLELEFLDPATNTAVWKTRSAPFGTKPDPDSARTLVIGVGGGIDLWMAMVFGASQVTGVEV